MLNAVMSLKRKRGAVSILLATFILALPLKPVQALPKTEWLLEQRHHVSGVHLFKFTPTSIQVTCKHIGWKIVSKAPDWSVCAYRLDDKVKCTMDRRAFYLNRGFRAKKHRMENLKQIGTQTVGPLKAQVYTSRTYQVWVGRIKGIPVEVEDMIIAYHEARPVDGLMLKGIIYGVEGPEKKDTSFFSMDTKGPVVTVETLSLKQIPYNAMDFEVPRRLRETHDMEIVMTSAARRKEAEIMLEDMGVGETLGSKKKR